MGEVEEVAEEGVAGIVAAVGDEGGIVEVAGVEEIVVAEKVGAVFE